MLAVFIAAPHPVFHLLGISLCLFACALWASLAALKFSYRTIRKVATALLLAIVLAVAVPLVETQTVYWAPYCEGWWAVLNFQCWDFSEWL